MKKQQFDIGTYFTIQYYAKNTTRQLQDEDNSQKNVSLERIKFMAFHISDTLTWMQME